MHKNEVCGIAAQWTAGWFHKPFCTEFTELSANVTLDVSPTDMPKQLVTSMLRLSALNRVLSDECTRYSCHIVEIDRCVFFRADISNNH